MNPATAEVLRVMGAHRSIRKFAPMRLDLARYYAEKGASFE